jgi:four helix bundle protein
VTGRACENYHKAGSEATLALRRASGPAGREWVRRSQVRGLEWLSMSSGLRDLRVWQEAVALAADVVRAVRPTIRRETKVISDALMTSALLVPSHIADGFARPTPGEQRESYLAAKRALLRLESEMAVARQADLVAAGSFGDIAARAGQVARLLTGYLVYLDRQISDRESPSSPAAPAAVPAASTRDSVRAHA